MNQSYENLQWREESPVAEGVMYAGCAAADGYIYQIGGLISASPSRFSNSLQIFDTATGEWTTGADLPLPLDLMGCQSWEGKLYCIGGRRDSGTYVSSVYIYDREADRWDSGAAMPGIKGHFGCALYRDEIYCFGGTYYSNSRLVVDNSVYIYHIPSNAWRRGQNMPVATSNLKAAAVQDKIWCFSGLTKDSSGNLPETNTIAVYDPAADNWVGEVTGAPELPGYDYSLAADDSAIYITGGRYNRETSSRCVRYDKEADAWSELPSMLYSRENHGSVCVSGRLYCIAGYTATGAGLYTPTAESLGTDAVAPAPGIVHRYLEENGGELLPDTLHSAQVGERYTASAPGIEGYACIGHRIGGGMLQSGLTAIIDAVPAAGAVITFVYRREEDGGSPAPGSCCCGPTVEINIRVRGCNRELLEDVARSIAGHLPANGCNCR